MKNGGQGDYDHLYINMTTCPVKDIYINMTTCPVKDKISRFTLRDYNNN